MREDWHCEFSELMKAAEKSKAAILMYNYMLYTAIFHLPNCYIS